MKISEEVEKEERSGGGRQCLGGEVAKDRETKQTDIYIKIIKKAAMDFCPAAQQSAGSRRSISQILVAAIDYPRIHWETCQPLGPALTSQDK